MDLKGCVVVQVEAGNPRQKEQPGKVSMFCSYWVEVTVVWGIGLFQCFSTEAQLVFEGLFFLCRPGILGSRPHPLNASSLSGRL